MINSRRLASISRAFDVVLENFIMPEMVRPHPPFRLLRRKNQTRIRGFARGSIDALILRYSQCVSMIQDQLFRGIAYVEQEDISDKSNRDKTLLMEKLGAIKSADEFGTAAVLRNKFSHHYPEEIDSRIERLNLVIEEAGFVIATFDEINNYIRRKGFAI
jgi:hypothetical protein